MVAHEHGITVGFKLNKLKQIGVHGPIASVEVDWQMIMPDSIGIHCTYFHIVNTENQWLVANVTDHGYEEAKK